ncbi:MAG: hypothetical protein KDB90_15585 [Planctomycetes bacterium]|nr:hypothetical protein [Planctomycetota bacterium]
MGQHAASPLRPPPGARAVVFRGDDASAVARAVREAAGDGFVLPVGPYRYPYAAVVQLLRDAGLYLDPAGETATDPVLSREALTDMLRTLLPRGVRIGILDATRLDRASADLLGALAATAQLATEYGFAASGLIIGAPAELPESLQLPKADIREVAAHAQPTPEPSSTAVRLLRLLMGAPHPVREESLAAVAALTQATLRSALNELAAAEMVETRARIGLGPAQISAEPLTGPWLESAETLLPCARLAVQPDPGQARHLAREAWQRGEPETAAYYFSLSGEDAGGAADDLLFGRALAATGAGASAREILLRHEDDPAGILDTAMLGAELAEQGEISMAHTEKLLRRAERTSAAPLARAVRAKLLLKQGNADAARNLLRRTTKAELGACPPEVRLEHELAVIAATANGIERHLREAAACCTTRLQSRRLAAVRLLRDSDAEVLAAKLAAESLDAHALRLMSKDAISAALRHILEPIVPTERSLATDPAALFARLRAHGATVLAALIGDRLEIQPPAARTRPGLASQLEEKLLRLRARPQALSLGRDEFSGLGPFAGGSALVLFEYGTAGPLIVVFRTAGLPMIEHLLGDK